MGGRAPDRQTDRRISQTDRAQLSERGRGAGGCFGGREGSDSSAAFYHERDKESE